MGEVIACANQKGGVGKTTTVVNLASYLARAGRRILIVDLDPQGNATSGVGLSSVPAERSVHQVLVEGAEARALIQPTAIEGLSIIPSSRDLAGAEVELVPLFNRERRLARGLADVRDEFDTILLDCPPSLGLLTVNALTAADSVLVPIQCEYYALEGLGQLLGTIDLVKAHLNPPLTIKGVLLTMFDARTTLSADVSAEVREHLPDRVFRTVIPRSVRLAEAPSHGRPVSEHAPTSRGATAYAELADELLARDGVTPIVRDLVPPAPEPAWVTRS
ncbi:MAG: ParA family protein [Chloroflexi bacterium]|nr:ParA family protein [Chloroflexota bacterium]